MIDLPTKRSLAQDIGFSLPAHYNASRLLWDNLDQNAQRLAILSDQGTFTYRQLVSQAGRIGHALCSAGCQPKDRILLFLDDEPSYPAALMGAMRAGLVPVLVNTLSPPELLRYCLLDSNATAAVVSPQYMNLFTATLLGGTACRHVLSSAADAPWRLFDEALNEHPTTRDDMAFWMYSSGTTGRPKGVVHKHEDAAYTAKSYAQHILKIKSSDICFSIPKIFFAYGFGNSITFPMSVGAAAVLLSERPTPERVYAHIGKYQPTILFGLPTLYNALIRSQASERANLSSVRLCISAAEILSSEIAAAWQQRFGHNIVEGLGSTELLHIYLSNDEQCRQPGAAGRAVPGYAIRLETPDGRDAAPGEEGTMLVCGLSGAQYYWERPDNTAETMRGEWIYTGDRFICNKDGFYFFRGRADDLVKVSGQWVYPLEIELILNEHPKVDTSCVQALEEPDKSLTLIAWVAPKSGVAANSALARELQDYAKRALLPHKYPRKIVFLEELPKTGTDKIDRQRLKQDYTGISSVAPA